MNSFYYILGCYFNIIVFSFQFIYAQNNIKIDCIEYIERGELDEALICIHNSNQLSVAAKFYYLAKCKLVMGESYDSVFYYLDSYVSNKCENKYFTILTDPNFYSLHPFPEWNQLRTKILNCRVKHYPTLDTNGVRLLMEMFENDQMYRMLNFGVVRLDYNHPERNNLKEEIIQHDSIARDLFLKYISSYGWPTKSDSSAREILFFLTLVVLHSPSEISAPYKRQFRKYFRQGLLNGSTWAAYFDRYLSRAGRRLKFSVPLVFDSVQDKYVTDGRRCYRIQRINRNRKRIGIEPFTLPYRY